MLRQFRAVYCPSAALLEPGEPHAREG